MIYIFIISLLVLQTLVVTESLTLNVRTTLFTPADLARKRWNRRDVALLTARMYFQSLLPPMDVNRNANYVRTLIRYIENCYASVDQEALDSETGTILTIAVSDVLGGYLKMVALPVAKSAFYRDELPTQDALKLFKYYDDIKEQLGTDGRGWSEQLTNIVKTKNVRGPRSDSLFTKIKNPCQQLYLKNNQKNLTMPLPSIDWNTRMMFVPLTNQPIVDLRSPYINNNVLQQFHQIATACERSMYPDRHYFQGTFDDWVNEAVIPHLSDDDLYTAFKGILCLLENTNLISAAENSTPGIYFFTSNFHNMSKKTIIILSILTLELICCIPTLLFCVLKKKKKKHSCSGVTPMSSASATSISRAESKKVAYNDKTVLYELSSGSASFHGPTKLNSRVNFTDYSKIKVNEANSDLSTAPVSRQSYSSITDASNTADEGPTKKYSKSSEKILSTSQQQLRYKQTETDKINTTQNQTQVCDWPLLSRTNSTSTAINLNTRTSSKNASNETGETVTLATVLQKDKSSSKVLRKSKRFRPRHKIESLNSESGNPSPSCNVILHERSKDSNAVEELKLQLFDEKLGDVALMRFDSGKSVEFAALVGGNETRAKNSEMSYNRSQSHRSIASKRDSMRTITIVDEQKTQMFGHQDSPVEIRMGRSRQRISAKVSNQGITMNNEVPKNRKGILKVGEEKATMRTKKSRIPKKTNSPGPLSQSPRPVRREPEGPRRKSRIPRLERALDDSAISSATPRDRKLNVTL